ncbi:hypothetical protein [Clostridium sp.]|uniref:hypothetical protein n=1 Tax=Clostridium sp. TaxID=1506 RepID=UPI00284AF3E0|nr:hypothetical protein [Clostridium sp.]MDR3595047.1 hypothetical protein [Clostridium sp.]
MVKNIIYSYDESILKVVDDLNKPKKYKKVLKNWGLISSIIVVILTLSAGARKLSMFNYYGINTEFFKYSIQDIFVVAVPNFIIWFLAVILPIITRNYEPQGVIWKILKRGMLILITVTVGIYYSRIIFRDYDINNKNIQNVVFFIILFITYCGLKFMYFNINIINIKTKLNKSKFFWIRLFFKMSCLLLLLAIMVAVTFCNFIGVDIQNNQKYTIVDYKSNKYVILLAIDSRAVIANYNEDECTINCKTYKIIDPKDYEMENIVFKNPPKIIK